MKRILLFSFIFTLCCNLQAQVALPTLDSNATVSVITCGPGSDFYTTFGHTAIRICDTAMGIDIVYNYGSFDFNTDHFYLKFAQGRLNYYLSRDSYSNFIFDYAYEGRAVSEQVLKMTPQEKQNLFVLLETNYLPEYRYYLYDMFRDNCATRIRDVINSALGHRTLFEEYTPKDAKSFRQLLYGYTQNSLQWWQLGIDIVIGSRCDRPCSSFGYTFAPQELMLQLDTTRVSDTQEPLAMPAKTVLTDCQAPQKANVSPILTFWVLLVIVVALTIISWKKLWTLRWLDILLFCLDIIVAIVIIFLWFFSNHYCTKWNWNILWASPLYLYFAVRGKKSAKWMVYAQLACFAALGIVALCGVQQFNAAILPIALMLFVRTINLLRTETKQHNNRH